MVKNVLPVGEIAIDEQIDTFIGELAADPPNSSSNNRSSIR